MGGIKNNAGQGLTIVLNHLFVLQDPEELLVYLKTLKPGNIVRVASHIDPTPKLTDEIREIFTALGSTVVKSLKPRDSWVFTVGCFIYWPEMGEIIGCFPRISETE
uniref:ILEI/PANDER domain-containing protein n=1 Tax=Sinocyclocheilus rhinocerous TaxID=307959 RepID=A0A673GAI1_9TELE